MILSDALIFNHIAVSNTVNKVAHRIFNTDLSYTFAHFPLEIDEKSSHNVGF